MRRFLSVVGSVLLVFAMLLGLATSANAATGSPDDEVNAYFTAFLHRAPEAGPNDYVNRVHEDCKWGLLQAAYNIGDSAESHNANPAVADKVTAAYRGLLGRDPDASGLDTYTAATNARGFRFTIMDLMASDEFHGRLNSICNGHTTSNVNVLSPNSAVGAATGLMDAAYTESKACSIGVISGAATSIAAAAASGPAAAVAAIQGAAFAVRGYASSPIRACWTTIQTIRAANRIIELASFYGDDNPTFIGMHQWEVRKHVWDPKVCHVTMWYGPGPSEYETTQVEFNC